MQVGRRGVPAKTRPLRFRKTLCRRTFVNPGAVGRAALMKSKQSIWIGGLSVWMTRQEQADVELAVPTG
jgi:hypothetical protein